MDRQEKRCWRHPLYQKKNFHKILSAAEPVGLRLELASKCRITQNQKLKLINTENSKGPVCHNEELLQMISCGGTAAFRDLRDSLAAILPVGHEGLLSDLQKVLDEV
eukprot:scpid97945/ scgid14439/ 